MTSDDTNGPDTHQQGDQYCHTDGTTEVVYLVEDGHVLTFREYPSLASFSDAVASAAYDGYNEAVASLPERSTFTDEN